jgi:hypothetical protein
MPVIFFHRANGQDALGMKVIGIESCFLLGLSEPHGKDILSADAGQRHVELFREPAVKSLQNLLGFVDFAPPRGACGFHISD